MIGLRRGGGRSSALQGKHGITSTHFFLSKIVFMKKYFKVIILRHLNFYNLSIITNIQNMRQTLHQRKCIKASSTNPPHYYCSYNTFILLAQLLFNYSLFVCPSLCHNGIVNQTFGNILIKSNLTKSKVLFYSNNKISV